MPFLKHFTIHVFEQPFARASVKIYLGFKYCGVTFCWADWKWLVFLCSHYYFKKKPFEYFHLNEYSIRFNRSLLRYSGNQWYYTLLITGRTMEKRKKKRSTAITSTTIKKFSLSHYKTANTCRLATGTSVLHLHNHLPLTLSQMKVSISSNLQKCSFFLSYN